MACTYYRLSRTLSPSLSAEGKRRRRGVVQIAAHVREETKGAEIRAQKGEAERKREKEKERERENGVNAKCPRRRRRWEKARV